MQREQLTGILDDLMQPQTMTDYCPNGLQVEGRSQITKIVSGVTASQAFVNAAIAANADAVLVHHGYFWKGENAAITGMKKQRIAALLAADINVYAYHLPLDVHPTLGNNAQLAALMNWQVEGALAEVSPHGVVMHGRLAEPATGDALAKQLGERLQRPVTCAVHHTHRAIQTLAWCTGGGQGFIDQAAAAGVDCFITGEVSEQTIHSAREQGIDFIAAGHHATERYGVQALGNYLAAEHGLTHEFIEIDNPA
ncbi:MAG: Nif3-like dinuclear metal center hexameric protein [Idiomarina sp.]